MFSFNRGDQFDREELAIFFLSENKMERNQPGNHPTTERIEGSAGWFYDERRHVRRTN